MIGRQKLFSVLSFLLLAVPVLKGAGLGNADLTKRHADLNDKRFPMKMHDMELNREFGGQRIPMEKWEAEFSPLGRKRAAIAVEERDRKSLRQPKIVEMEKVERKMAPMNGRRAFLRNMDKVEEKELVADYRNAPVTHINEMSRPAMSPRSEEQRELSMREINRFSFQRNHSETGGASVQQAGSGKNDE